TAGLNPKAWFIWSAAKPTFSRSKRQMRKTRKRNGTRRRVTRVSVTCSNVPAMGGSADCGRAVDMAALARRQIRTYRLELLSEEASTRTAAPPRSQDHRLIEEEPGTGAG